MITIEGVTWKISALAKDFKAGAKTPFNNIINTSIAGQKSSTPCIIKVPTQGAITHCIYSFEATPACTDGYMDAIAGIHLVNE